MRLRQRAGGRVSIIRAGLPSTAMLARIGACSAIIVKHELGSEFALQMTRRSE